MVGIPCLLAVILIRRGNDGFRPIGIGVAAFVFSQAGHIPFNQFVLLPALEGGGIGLSQSGWKLLVMGIAVGFSAGIFEETARYLSFRFWLNKEPSTLLPIKYGVGHGGIEAFLLGILTLYALIQVLTLGGEGSLDSFSSEQAGLIRAQIFAYWDVPWQHLLLGAWERVSAMIFHIGASLMVYKSVRKKSHRKKDKLVFKNFPPLFNNNRSNSIHCYFLLLISSAPGKHLPGGGAALLQTESLLPLPLERE